MTRRYSILTPKAVKALAPGESLREHGIIADRLSNGELRWSINTQVDWQRIHRTVGYERNGASRAEAELMIETYRSRARESRLSLPKARKTHKSFAEASLEYLDRLRREGGKNMVQKETHIRLHLVPKLGSLRINCITEEHLARYREERTKEKRKPATINRELATLSHFFKKASHRKWKWMSRDDIPDIPMTPEQKMPFYVLSPEQIGALLEAAAEDHDKQVLPFILISYGSTMRPSEVLASRFENLLSRENRLWIPFAKTGDRAQPITRVVRDLILSMQAEHFEETGEMTGWVFPSHRAREGHRVNIYKSFYRVVERANLDRDKVKPYTLRRTSITDVADTGIDLAGLMKISGHKTVVSVLRYVQTRDERIAKAMTALEVGPPSPTRSTRRAAPKLHRQRSKARSDPHQTRE